MCYSELYQQMELDREALADENKTVAYNNLPGDYSINKTK